MKLIRINRKGITPVIAVVLLLMMTVAAAGAAYFWMTTIQSRIQGQIGTQVSETTLTSTTSLNLISTVCASDDGVFDTINITMQNTGSNTISKGVAAITVTDTQDRVIKTALIQPDTADATGHGMDTPLIQNQIMTLNFTWADSANTILIGNSTFGVKLTLPGGAEQTSDCIAQDII